ncbi:MAG: T9SS type A sorting domain-containing protein [Gammaproteobacteria bacterium]|nr:T9SS type A sorting domain-containing protein [Gammaproteobacteria bacterium]
MRLRNPEDGDYRPLAGSAAEAYGCQTFHRNQKTDITIPNLSFPAYKQIISGNTAEVGGLISEDTLWDASIIRVTESVEVASNATLTINPGTRVEFTGFFKLLVRGRLWAVGQPHNPIYFTPEIEQIEEGWDGIEFLNIPAANDSSRMEHCHISYSVAKTSKEGVAQSQAGGAVSIIGVNKLCIASCLFENNRADYGAAIYCGYGSSPVIAGNLFQNNTATWNGSVLFNVYAYPKLINNTLVDNTCLAESEFYLCGAVENFNGKIPMINNIIWYNFTNHYDGSQLVCNKDYYTLSNNIEGYVGNDSNLVGDPGFYGEGENPYQLNSESLCIDQGITHALSDALAAHDVVGMVRVHGDQIDLGAYEYYDQFSSVTPQSAHLSLSCFPNPFNPCTQFVFNLPKDGQVQLTVYDLHGQQICTLVNSWQNSGRHEVSWNGLDDSGRTIASGTYFYRLVTGDFSESRIMTLLK